MVSNVTVSASPAATAYQSGSLYTLSFVATDGISSNGLHPITVVGPSGTNFDYVFGSEVTDHTNPADSRSSCDDSTPASSNVLYLGSFCDLNIPAGDSVTVQFYGTNPATPSSSYTLSVATDNDPTAATSAPYPILNEGYWLVGSDGGIFTFGNAQFYGSTGNLHLNRPVVGITPTASRSGYWLDASDGGIFSFGDTGFYGSIPALGLHPAGSGLPNSLNAPIVGMVPSVDDHGYFMVASDGGVFAFGDASFEGSCPGIGGCNGNAVAVLPDASGNGYWLATSTGSVYAFGDAKYLGAPGNTGSPITSAVRTPDGQGYWILDAAGHVHAYGDAGSLGNDTSAYISGSDPANAIFTDLLGDGYGVATADGVVTTFGGVPNDGGMQNTNLNGPIIAAAGF
jgi:hypothetical protein